MCKSACANRLAVLDLRIMPAPQSTIPQVLYNTRDPLLQPSELYVINAAVLDAATDPIKRWVMKEEHGFWDEQAKEFKNRATTFHPNDPKHCLSLSDADIEVEKQVMRRVKDGFKYQF